MIIPSAILKKYLKKLGLSRAEHVVLDPAGVLHAGGINLTVLVTDPLLQSNEDITSVNLKQFSSAVDRLSGDVEVVQDVFSVAVRSGRTRYELPTSKPLVPASVVSDTAYQVPVDVFCAALKYASTAVETKEALDFRGAVQVIFEEGHVLAFGADGRRLAVADLSCPGTGRLQIPGCLAQAAKELAGFGETLQVTQTEGAVKFSVGNISIAARKFTKVFPDMRSPIPKSFKFQTSLAAEQMREALHKVSPAVDKDKQRVSLSFKEILTLKVTSAAGRAEDEIDYTKILPSELDDPSSFEIDLNHGHLASFFDQVQGLVNFSGNDRNSAVWLTTPERKLLLTAFK